MSDAAGLLAFLDLEQIDRDIFRGRPGVWPDDRVAIYGGEVAAQALRAAAYTVPDGRLPHSLHGYFLRRGDPVAPVVFVVDRDRDGRSFSARRVAAMQDGEVIWEMACSFVEPADGPTYEPPATVGYVDPEQAPGSRVDAFPLVDIRLVPPADGSPGGEGSSDRCWTRVVTEVADDPLLHACLLVFASDVAAGFGDIAVPGIPPFGPSIDHAVWFHEPCRAEEWVIWDCTAAKVRGHVGLYTGTARTQDGRLVAMIAQEMLLRPPRDGGSGNP